MPTPAPVPPRRTCTPPGAAPLSCRTTLRAPASTSAAAACAPTPRSPPTSTAASRSLRPPPPSTNLRGTAGAQRQEGGRSDPAARGPARTAAGSSARPPCRRPAPPRRAPPRPVTAMAAVWEALGALGRELAAEWATQDVRAALCQLLLLWLGLSLMATRLAWRAYGEEVAALCYRPAARRPPAPSADSGPAPARPRAHSLSPARRDGAAERHCPPR